MQFEKPRVGVDAPWFPTPQESRSGRNRNVEWLQGEGTDKARAGDIKSADYLGPAMVDGAPCDHYAFRQGKVDWQIWITTGAKPLPRKVVITNRADDARPQSVSLIDWNLKPTFKDSVFKFTPPQGTSIVKP